MSAALDPLEVLTTVPGISTSEFRIDALSGGLTNRVYKLSGAHDTYVMRLDAEHTAAFGLNRSTEFRVLLEAGKRRLAPEIVYSNANKSILLLRYIEGRVWTSDDLTIDANLEALAELLRAVHALPLSGKKFDANAIAERYQENIQCRPEMQEFGNHCKAIVESIDIDSAVTCCHNDIVAANVIACPRLMLLDWEYACDNDPLFDIASLIAYHSMNVTAAMTLLSAYAGTASPDLREQLSVQIRLFRALHCLWLASRQAISPTSAQVETLNELSQELGYQP